MRDGRLVTVEVTADGAGLVSHAGSALLAAVADTVGLTRALSGRLGVLKARRRGHDPGRVIRDLAVMLADGGEGVSDLGAVREQAAPTRPARRTGRPTTAGALISLGVVPSLRILPSVEKRGGCRADPRPGWAKSDPRVAIRRGVPAGRWWHHLPPHKGQTMNPYVNHQMARARQADLLREAEDHRRAGLTARPTVLSRVTARIPRFTAGSGRSREGVVAPSTPGRS